MSFSAKQKAFWIALPFTSFVSSLSFAAIGLIGSNDRVRVGEQLQVIGAYTLIMIPFVAIAGLLFGLPLAALLRRFHLLKLPALLVAGAFGGSLFSGLVLGLLAIDKTGQVMLRSASIGLLPGLTAALIWWFLVERKFAVQSAND